MTDQALLDCMSQDPEVGMAALMEQYAGLVWAVVARSLHDPEDIRECVNDTFAEFYEKRERFDPEKGSLKLFLAVLASRRAVDRFRSNSRREKTVPLEEEQQAPREPVSYEDREALKAAIARLPEQDAAILRMKYYGGMSFREIAASLNLPYETVKKRHVRSLGKLKKYLLTGLVLALLALLAACAYFVLRYFGLVPGYGVNTDPESAVYVLTDAAAGQEADGEIHLEDAWWQDGKLTVLLTFYGQFSQTTPPETALEGLEDCSAAIIGHSYDEAAGRAEYRLVFSGGLPPDTEEKLSLTLTVEETKFPLTLEQAEEASLDESGFYSLTEEGGLLAVPRLEQGELVVSIYPLNAGEFRTEPMLTRSGMTDWGGAWQPVTVTAPDGTVIEGELKESSYSPDSGDAYLDWYFGPAEPGEYTLNVPYVFQYPAEGESTSFDLSLTGGSGGPVLTLPGGTLEIGAPQRVESPADCGVRLADGYDRVGYRWYALPVTWTGEDPLHSPVAAWLGTAFSGYQVIDGVSYHNTMAQYWSETQYDEESGREYARWRGWLLGATEGQDTLTLTVDTGKLCYRWDHPFTISMTVEPEEERERFTQTSGYYTLTAEPRRERSGVTVALSGQSEYDRVSISPTTAHNPLTGAEDEPVTLTDGSGTVWEATFQPGRDGTYSDWSFGDVPPGEYILHVPCLYLTGKEESHVAVPLPQQAGEVLPVGDAWIYGCQLQFSPITGLGRMEEMPGSGLAGVCAIGMPDGSVISSVEELPLEAGLTLSYPGEEGEWMTLLDVGVKLGITGEGSEGTACELEYTDSADGARLTGLLLRYVPELYAADLTFVHPIFRLNQSFDIPVRIPE